MHPLLVVQLHLIYQQGKPLKFVNPDNTHSTTPNCTKQTRNPNIYRAKQTPNVVDNDFDKGNNTHLKRLKDQIKCYLPTIFSSLSSKPSSGCSALQLHYTSSTSFSTTTDAAVVGGIAGGMAAHITAMATTSSGRPLISS
jgi:hypothetical protein